MWSYVSQYYDSLHGIQTFAELSFRHNGMYPLVNETWYVSSKALKTPGVIYCTGSGRWHLLRHQKHKSIHPVPGQARMVYVGRYHPGILLQKSPIRQRVYRA
jgi:hypothetical protein